MIAFFQVMTYELRSGEPQRLFTKQDHAVQAGLFDCPDESPRVGIQIGRSGWQLH